MKNYKVSVIVPVYDVSKYLRKCVDSIINQTLEEIEIILVNDFSPDPLDEKICLEYESRYNNVRYIRHENNKNLGAARNTGLKKANGEYIGFVDSDDWVSEDMYENMYEKAKETGLPIINCGILREYENGKPSRPLNANCTTKDAVWTDILDTFLKTRSGEIKQSFPSSVCNKLYQRQFLKENELYFEEGHYFEETVFTIESFYYANKMLLLTDNYYHWRIREGSISTTVTKKHIDSVFNAYEYTKDFLKKRNDYSDRIKALVEKTYYNLLFNIYIKNHLQEGMSFIPYISQKVQEISSQTDFLEYMIKDLMEIKSKYREMKRKYLLLEETNINLKKHPGLKIYKRLSIIKRRILSIFIPSRKRK